MISASLKRNQKLLKEFKKRVVKIDNSPAVHVGLLSDGKPRSDDSSYTNAEIGAVHEYGAPDAGIPQRPWLRPAIRKNQQAYADLIQDGMRKELQGVPALSKALKLVGVKAVADVKLFVTAGDQIPPPNAPATLKAKEAKGKSKTGKGARTLVDTSQMINGVNFKLVEPGKKSK